MRVIANFIYISMFSSSSYLTRIHQLSAAKVEDKKINRKPSSIMSKRRGKGPKLELKLNLSPTRSSSQDVESNHSPNSSRGSSCASTDPAGGEISGSGSNMVLVGCPRCLMFVMLPEADPRCPQCKSAILLDFVSGDVLSPSAAKKGR